MDTSKARQIANEAIILVELVGQFQANFGREYRMRPGSPELAWMLDKQIQDQQVAIAKQLDIDALEHPFSRYGHWWERCDVVDDYITAEIASESVRLLSACSHFESNLDGVEWSPAIQVIQRSIAGMIPPHSRQMGMERDALVVDAM